MAFMKKCIGLASFLFISITSIAQDEINIKNDSIVQEGKALYQSEMASWYGTDIFLEVFKDHDKIGGYFSYPQGNAATCVFFSREDAPKIIGTIKFDSSYSLQTAVTELSERDFLPEEYQLYKMRKKAQQMIRNDTFFVSYNNTALNMIPVIYKGQQKVYVLTGPKKSGIVILGNDYLLTFDNNFELLEKKRLHMNIITIDYTQKAEDGSKVVGAAHTHLPETGDCMTVTDVCTLMLYQKFAGWETHTVVSKNYISFWNCKTNTLFSITRQAMNKINNDQKKRNKKNN